MLVLILLAGTLYLIIIGLFYWGWIKTKPWKSNKTIPNIKVSVIIPLRNEECNILQLLHSLKAQNYPTSLFELIIVNDHSTDNSVEIISQFNHPSLILLNLPSEKEGKKAALLEGSIKATGELIITTDADCILHKDWINTMVSFYAEFHSKMIVAPITIHSSKSIFSKFQELEFLSLQGSTAGAISIGHPIMCNGANLAFSRDCLPIIQQTYTNNQTASGDDIFALMAIKKQFPGQVHYLKSITAIATTNFAPSAMKFLNQRKRWTTKARFYTDPFLIITALIVLLINLLILFSLIQALNTNNWTQFLILFILKSTIDFPFLYSVSDFFNSKKLLRWFLIFQSFYFLYISFTFVLSLFGGYTWKSRKIRA